MHANHCTNPECDCTELRFALRQDAEEGETGSEGLRLLLRIDSETWEEIEPPSRPAPMALLVREFLDDYPPREKQALRNRCQSKKRAARRMRQYRFDSNSIANGKLVAFGEILADRRAEGAALAYYAYEIEHQGTQYIVDDLYCPNPDCNCREVRLIFIRCMPPSGPDEVKTAEDHFLATMPLAGRPKVTECYACALEEAKAILAAWWDRHHDRLRDHTWRYDKVKEIARRGPSRLEDRWSRLELPSEEPEPETHVSRAGRNDPCPCGSGKKFKKCCGQKSGIAGDLEASELE